MVFYGPSSCTGLFYKLFCSIYVKEIKIATGDDVPSNSRFCLVYWHLGKFAPRLGGWLGGTTIYVGAKGRNWTQLSHRKLIISIWHRFLAPGRPVKNPSLDFKNSFCFGCRWIYSKLTGRPGARNLWQHYVKWKFLTFCGLTGSNTYP